MDERQDGESLDLRDYLLPLWNRRWLVLAIVAVATAATFAYYSSRPDSYTARSKLFLETSELEQALGVGNADSSADPDRAAANMAEIARSPAVARAAADKIGHRGRLNPLLKKVKVTSKQGSDFLTITATDPTARGAARLANAFATAFIDTRSESDLKKVTQAVDETKAELASLGPQATPSARRRLQNRIGRLQAALSLPATSAQLIETASPPGRPAYPRPKRNAAFAFVLSFMLAGGLAYLLERLDRGIKRLDALEAAFGYPLLGILPREPDLGRGDRDAPEYVRERFRTLRTNIQLASLDRPIRSIVVSSGLAGEGKSLVLRNLALACREAGQHVAVVEADLRHPALARLFDLRLSPGLTDVLAGGHALETAFQPVPTTPDAGGAALATEQVAPSAVTNGGGMGSLDVLTSGPQPPNPPGLLSADRVRSLLDQIAASYDLVLIDSAPLLNVSDAVPLLSLADGIVLVSRIGVTTQDSARRTADLLARVPGANVLGVVANGVPKRDLVDGYGYAATVG